MRGPARRRIGGGTGPHRPGPGVGSCLDAIARLRGRLRSGFSPRFLAHFEQRGLSEPEIGYLYVAATGSEVLMFLVAPLLLRRFHPLALLLVAEAGTALRWMLLSVVDHVVPLAAVELLHSMTYGLWWAGMVHLIGTIVAPEVRTGGQGLLTTAFAAGLGAGAQLAGVARDSLWGPRVFEAAAALAAANLVMLACNRHRLQQPAPLHATPAPTPLDR